MNTRIVTAAVITALILLTPTTATAAIVETPFGKTNARSEGVHSGRTVETPFGHSNGIEQPFKYPTQTKLTTPRGAV